MCKCVYVDLYVYALPNGTTIAGCWLLVAGCRLPVARSQLPIAIAPIVFYGNIGRSFTLSYPTSMCVCPVHRSVAGFGLWHWIKYRNAPCKLDYSYSRAMKTDVYGRNNCRTMKYGIINDFSLFGALPTACMNFLLIFLEGMNFCCSVFL